MKENIDAPNMPGLLDIVGNAPTPTAEQYYSSIPGGRELSDMPLQGIAETKVDPTEYLKGLSPEQLMAHFKKEQAGEEGFTYEKYLEKWFPEGGR